MKALDEHILMVLFVLLLKRVHFLVNATTQMKALDEYICVITEHSPLSYLFFRSFFSCVVHPNVDVKVSDKDVPYIFNDFFGLRNIAKIQLVIVGALGFIHEYFVNGLNILGL